ncbi:NAD-dependent deacetylase [Desulfofundulus australicus DSM 11792]|jgi:NAD-dependent deacetylase|uniref:protein acetyllysine N-acetyltransferase n=1 Tax=Desulfofundulus australicus DSM 11792 TaxID=1121425 RepID=A0A1M4Z2Y2_9FIRM|nr:MULTISPECIES: NAD-dependent deacylase [Desulfofundulus]SHF12147.1 NAD-dependent deacetylase [Desulfofundulus australicus DSM 11792]
MTYEEKIRTLAELLRRNNRNFALTGAGVSTESGIPDFRSPGTGLWTKYDPIKTASLSALKRDPAAFYKINLSRWSAFSGVEPNDAHRAIARLEELGYLVGVITQNIDGLHQRAGSKRVWEIHGHLRTCHCMNCERSYPFSYLVEQFERGQNPPVCDSCRGVLRPDVVLFEDRMSEDFFKAIKALSGCQLLLVVGSSLQVYPAAGLPQFARRVVIINREPTPLDEQAELVIHDSAGRVFRDLMAELGEPLTG